MEGVVMRKFLFTVLPVFALACSSASSDPGSGSSSQHTTTSSSGSPSPGPANNTSSSSSSSSSGSSADAGYDAAAFSCGSPGDKGNDIGVGKYCNGITDCAGNTKAVLCATLGEPGAHFCTTQCSGAGDTSCGTGATCSCDNGQCGCVPDKCLH
jgi:hypothetical protein